MAANNNLTYLIFLTEPGKPGGDGIYLYAPSPSSAVNWWYESYESSLDLPLPTVPGYGPTVTWGPNTQLFSGGVMQGVLLNFVYGTTQANATGSFASLSGKPFTWKVYSVTPTTFNDAVRSTGARLRLARAAKR